MITRSVLALAMLAMLAASPVAAQEASRATQIIAQMPKEIGGVRSMSLGDGILMYLPTRLGRDPMLGVIVAENDDIDQPAEIRSFVRGTFHESGIRQVIREGTFTAAKWPGATTFFGEYVTGAGIKQSWTVMTGKEHITVLATYMNKKDAKRIESLVAEKFFGGAVISAQTGGPLK